LPCSPKKKDFDARNEAESMLVKSAKSNFVLGMGKIKKERDR
jgi:hypothetical protein